MTAPLDKEIAALGNMLREMGHLPPDAQQRVLVYLISRYIPKDRLREFRLKLHEVEKSAG